MAITREKAIEEAPAEYDPFDGFAPKKITKTVTLDAKVLNVRIDRSTIDQLIRDYVVGRTRFAMKNPGLDRKNIEIVFDFDDFDYVDVNVTVLP